MKHKDTINPKPFWADTIEVKPKIKTNIKMRVTPEQSEKIREICYKNGIKRLWGKKEEKFTKRNRFLCISKFVIGSYGLEDMFKIDGLEEIDADLFIRTNGTCIEEKQEFIYPMWFKSKKTGVIVKFNSLNSGEVVLISSFYNIGDKTNGWASHTNTEIWEQVQEPKENEEVCNHNNKIDEIILVDACNEHYKKQKIDTIARCKANMTLEQQKAICIFNIDKYTHREKGQNLSYIQKVRYYLDWLEEIENKLKDKE